MLDPQGFVATCNSTHFFIVRHPDGPDGPGEVWTSTGDYCMPGITRRNVLRLCGQNNVIWREKNFSVTECYGATEAFVTGTFAGIAPVTEIDGRMIGTGERGPMVEQLQQLYVEMLENL
jgi:branched-chain amino acid aminotransferase